MFEAGLFVFGSSNLRISLFPVPWYVPCQVSSVRCSKSSVPLLMRTLTQSVSPAMLRKNLCALVLSWAGCWGCAISVLAEVFSAAV